jgi:hypothetical protein
MNIFGAVFVVASVLCAAAFEIEISDDPRYPGWVLAVKNIINRYPIAVDSKVKIDYRRGRS